MGDVQATVALSNPRLPHLHPLEVTALADTGALMLCIPEHVVVQLQLERESMREVTVADGRVMQVPYVGPVRVEYQGLSRVKSLGRLASNKLAGEGRRWFCGCRVRQRGTGDMKAGPTRL